MNHPFFRAFGALCVFSGPGIFTSTGSGRVRQIFVLSCSFSDFLLDLPRRGLIEAAMPVIRLDRRMAATQNLQKRTRTCCAPGLEPVT
jgi:hypothetical protein